MPTFTARIVLLIMDPFPLDAIKTAKIEIRMEPTNLFRFHFSLFVHSLDDVFNSFFDVANR